MAKQFCRLCQVDVACFACSVQCKQNEYQHCYSMQTKYTNTDTHTHETKVKSTIIDVDVCTAIVTMSSIEFITHCSLIIFQLFNHFVCVCVFLCGRHLLLAFVLYLMHLNNNNFR